jgi:hypothetical protein
MQTISTETGMSGPLQDAGAWTAASAATGPAITLPHTTVEITVRDLLAMGTSSGSCVLT